MPNTGLACAFVAGLSDDARRILRSASRMESTDIGQNRDPAVLVDENRGAAAAGVTLRLSRRDRQAEATAIICRDYGRPAESLRSLLFGWT